MSWTVGQPPSGTRGFGCVVIPSIGENLIHFADFQADRVVTVPSGLYYDFEQVEQWVLASTTAELPSGIDGRGDEDTELVTYTDYSGT